MNKSRLQNILFTVSCALCIAASSCICLYAGLNYKDMDPVSFSVDQDDKTYYLKDKVTFYKGDFIKYTEQRARFIPQEDMFYTFGGLTSTELQNGSKFKKNDVIGKNGTQNVVASDDGMVLNTVTSSSGVALDCYLFGKFTIQLELSGSDYYSGDFIDKVHYADFDGTKKKMVFDGYDYSQVERNGLFLANYKCDAENLIVTESSFRGVFSSDGYRSQAVYTVGVFSRANETRSFVYKGEDDKWVEFFLHCEEIVDSCEIVSTAYLGFSLFSVGDIYGID